MFKMVNLFVMVMVDDVCVIYVVVWKVKVKGIMVYCYGSWEG